MEKAFSRIFNIDPKEAIQCNFAATRSISSYESIQVPVINVLLKHGKNLIVSDFWKSTYEITEIKDYLNIH